MSLLLTGGGCSTSLGGRVKHTGSPAALIRIPVIPGTHIHIGAVYIHGEKMHRNAKMCAILWKIIMHVIQLQQSSQSVHPIELKKKKTYRVHTGYVIMFFFHGEPARSVLVKFDSPGLQQPSHISYMIIQPCYS